jgi:SMODS domain-containing protein
VPRDVLVAFNELLARQALTPAQAQIANGRITDIRTFFNNKLQMAMPVFAVGSAARGTIAAGERDVDLMAAVANTYANKYRADSRQFLYDIRQLLTRPYPRTEVGARQVAVVLDFDVIRTEVVPCFKNDGEGFVMPNGTRGWMATNPPFHTALMQAADTAHGGRLKPLVRLVKAWNIAHGQQLRSFHLEMLVKRMWDGVAIGDWPAAVSATLQVLGMWVNASFVDPWQGTTRIDNYLSAPTRAQIIRTIAESAAAATTAETHRLAGRGAAAFERWQVIYRHAFPAYG